MAIPDPSSHEEAIAMALFEEKRNPPNRALVPAHILFRAQENVATVRLRLVHRIRGPASGAIGVEITAAVEMIRRINKVFCAMHWSVDYSGISSVSSQTVCISLCGVNGQGAFCPSLTPVQPGKFEFCA